MSVLSLAGSDAVGTWECADKGLAVKPATNGASSRQRVRNRCWYIFGNVKNVNTRAKITIIYKNSKSRL
jgi:hypothetical protein